jgi:hypothetical protein
MGLALSTESTGYGLIQVQPEDLDLVACPIRDNYF